MGRAPPMIVQVIVEMHCAILRSRFGLAQYLRTSRYPNREWRQFLMQNLFYRTSRSLPSIRTLRNYFGLWTLIQHHVYELVSLVLLPAQSTHKGSISDENQVNIDDVSKFRFTTTGPTSLTPRDTNAQHQCMVNEIAPQAHPGLIFWQKYSSSLMIYIVVVL